MRQDCSSTIRSGSARSQGMCTTYASARSAMHRTFGGCAWGRRDALHPPRPPPARGGGAATMNLLPLPLREGLGRGWAPTRNGTPPAGHPPAHATPAPRPRNVPRHARSASGSDSRSADCRDLAARPPARNPRSPACRRQQAPRPATTAYRDAAAQRTPSRSRPLTPCRGTSPRCDATPDAPRPDRG